MSKKNDLQFEQYQGLMEELVSDIDAQNLDKASRDTAIYKAGAAFSAIALASIIKDALGNLNDTDLRTTMEHVVETSEAIL